ncbi:MAG: hypothetical protein FWC75_08530 [Oscillospiraceae bacterium]|nr:hypothetical protein [Oscillospiraceae bacterium]
MKKLFGILSLVFGVLSFILGMACIVLLLLDFQEKLKSEKQAAVNKIKAYIAKKMDVVEVTPEEVTKL